MLSTLTKKLTSYICKPHLVTNAKFHAHIE